MKAGHNRGKLKSYAETNCESVLLFGKEHTEAQK